MDTELKKLRLDKGQKASRDGRSSWPIVLLVLLLAGGAVAFWRYRQNSAPIPVEIVRVRVPEGALLEHDLVLLNATGYIMAAHRIELASRVIGRVAWIGVEMGDKVKEGQVLVRLEDDEYKARLVQQQGQLNNAKAKLAELKAGSRPQEILQAHAQLQSGIVEMENSQRNFDRLKALGSNSSVTKQEIDNAESLWKARQAQVDSLQQQYELMKAGPRQEQIDAQAATVSQLEGAMALAQVDFDNTVIRSPVAATILERNVEVGEFVTNGFVGDRGAKGYVVSIADLNDLRVELDISQNDFAKVSDNQPCWITTDAYPDRKYDGTVDLIAPVANRQKATILVRVKITQPDSYLKPDMNANVSFLSAQKLAAAATSAATNPAQARPAIRIPAAAVQNGEVFVVEDGKALRRAVTLGSTSDDKVEVRKGLIGGEDLIIHSPTPLHDGDPVKISQSPN